MPAGPLIADRFHIGRMSCQGLCPVTVDDVNFAKDKTTQDAWNITWEDLFSSSEELSEVPESKGIYVIGSLQKAIRFHYEIIKKSSMM